MDTAKKWDRRFVLGAAAGMAGLTGLQYAFGSWTDRLEPEGGQEFSELLQRAVADLELPCNAGWIFLSTGVSGERERDVQGLVTLVRDRVELSSDSRHDWPWIGSDKDVDRLIHLFAYAIKEDFGSGDLCLVDGWQLSRTECRLAALKFLWEEDGAGGVVCRKEGVRPPAALPPQVERTDPPRTFVGVPFNVQQDGNSVISLHGSDFQFGAVVLFDGAALESAVGNSGWMTASVPSDLHARARTVDVAVRNTDGQISNVVQFEVVPRVLLEVTSTVPSGTSVGVPFTVQPNGQSVINVYGTGFLPGATVLFGGIPLESAVGDSGWMTAYVPADAYAMAGVVTVEVRNPDGTVSNAMRFEVTVAQGAGR